MRDLFPGFYWQEMTEAKIRDLWQRAIFIFDTNMLLNVYRYSSEARERYFEILTHLNQRIWVPYQVAYEYQDGRISVIKQQLDAYDDVSKILKTNLQELKKKLKTYEKKHSIIDPKELVNGIAMAVDNANSFVQRAKNDHPNFLRQPDLYREQLERLFLGKVGEPYSREKLEDLYRRADFRLSLKIPPGTEDEGKKNFRTYGDMILWFQIIDYAKSHSQPIIFTTDDLKEDWWQLGYEAQGRPRPRPELVQEMFLETGELFYMYQGFEFLEKAEKILQLEAKPDIIEEAKEVTEQNSIAKNYSVNITRYYGGDENTIVQSVCSWMSTLPLVANMEVEALINDYASDAVLTLRDNTKVFVEIKSLRFLHLIPLNKGGRTGEIDTKRLFKLVAESMMNIRSNTKPEDIKLVILVATEWIGVKIISSLMKTLVVEENTCIVVGLLDENGDFHFYSAHPEDFFLFQ